MSVPPESHIDAATRCCAVYGCPIGHSASPAFQNAGLAAMGLNWRYLAFEVRPSCLRAALDGAKAMKFAGLNLTVPHKLMAVEMVDVLDETARMLGAVNTIRFEGRAEDGPWLPLGALPPDFAGSVRSHGFNTDADAIIRALEEDLNLKLEGTRVLVLGAGGAGRAAALRLAAGRVGELFLANRTPEKAEAVAREIAQRFPGARCRTGYPDGEIDLALNATSAGLKAEDPLPYDGKQLDLRKAKAAYDMIYRPVETPFLKAARQAGCRTANGASMLLHQGVKALELWTGRPAPVAVMREALLRFLYRAKDES